MLQIRAVFDVNSKVISVLFVKISHRLVATGAVGVRGPLYLWHGIGNGEPIPLPLLPYPSLVPNRYPLTAGSTRVSSLWMAKPEFELTTFR